MGRKISKGLLFIVLVALPLAGFMLVPMLFAAGEGPQISSVSSYTHPVESAWYQYNDPTLSWSTAQDLALSGISSEASGLSFAVAASGNMVYTVYGTHVSPSNPSPCATPGNCGLRIAEMSGTPAATLNNRSSIDIGGFGWDVAVRNNIAYVAADARGLVIINVQDPAHPAILRTLDTQGIAQGVAVSGDYAYVADSQGGLRVIDVKNPAAPVLKATLGAIGNVRAVAVEGNHAYLGVYGEGLVVVDISNPLQPVIAGAYANGHYAVGVAASGDYAYMVAGSQGMTILDVSNPAAPALPPEGSSVDLPGHGVQGVTIAGKYAFLAYGWAGLQVVNIDPTHQDYLQVKAAYATQYYSRDVAVTPTYVFLADQNRLRAFQIKKPVQYSYLLDHNPGTEPDPASGATIEISGENESLVLPDVADGDWYFHIIAKDDTGAWGPAAHRQIKIDTVAPVTQHDAPSGWQTQDFNIHFECSDSASQCKRIMVGDDAGAWQYYAGASGTHNISSDGDHTITFFAEDNAANREYPQIIHAKLDKTKPEVTEIVYGGPYPDGSASVNAYFSDAASGIDPASVSLKLDGVIPSNCTAAAGSISCQLASLALGDHTVELKVKDNAGNDGSIIGEYMFTEDKVPPVTTTNAPAGWVKTDFNLQISCTDNASGCKRVGYKVNGGAYQYANAASAAYTIKTEGDNTVLHFGEDQKGNKEAAKTAHVKIDRTPPAIYNIRAGLAPGGSAAVMAYYSDPLSGVNAGSAAISVYGTPLTGCYKDATYIACPVSGVPREGLPLSVSVSDNAGNGGTVSGLAMLTRDYFWTWYDAVNMRSWILMANRSGGPQLNFSLSVGGADMGLGNLGMGAGVVPGGMTLTPIYPGMMAGPVRASSMNGSKAIVSQRSLMGDSFEEVLGTEAEKLSDHFYWSWYDMASPGYSNWILVANPSDKESVHAVITFTNADGQPVKSENDIAPGQNWNPTFPGKMGGPVQVKAYRTGGSWNKQSDHREVMASQRVLSNNGTAFNEVPGIPREELHSEYIWTWYDMASEGYRNWVLIANPDPVNAVNCEVAIAGAAQYIRGGCSIPAGGMITPEFPGVMNGPVTVKAWKAADSTPADVIASQRVTAGPSFEEVPGYRQDQLEDNYHWTWYDMTSGFTNWVLIANPGNTTVSYEILIGGVKQNCGACTIAPHGRVTPTFPGLMNGPVEVRSTKGEPLMVSQRATRFGFFNEVLGTVLDS